MPVFSAFFFGIFFNSTAIGYARIKLKCYSEWVYQKIVWMVAAALLAGLGVWLGWVMPAQAWAQWDGQAWHIVAEGWAVLGYGGPLVALGMLVGALGAEIGLAWTLKHAKEADFRAEIARLTHERDTAVSQAEQRVLEREQTARRCEATALAAQREAQAVCQRAKRVQVDAEQAVTQAQVRARNAIHAAERIKRRIEGRQRHDA